MLLTYAHFECVLVEATHIVSKILLQDSSEFGLEHDEGRAVSSLLPSRCASSASCVFPFPSTTSNSLMSLPLVAIA